MIDQLYEIVIEACGGSLTMEEIGWLFFVVKQLVTVSIWLINKFERFLKDVE